MGHRAWGAGFAAESVLTTAMLRHRMEARAGGLGVEGSAVPPRSRSLTAALDASVVLLTPAEREVLWP